MRIAQNFDGMLEFVSDCRNQFIVISTGIHDNPQYAIGARHLDAQGETCPHIVTAPALLNIYKAVGRIDRFDEAPECRRPCGAFVE
jgi:hypothetical protein